MQGKLKDLEIESLDEDTMQNKYLTFYTDNQLFGIPIADVVQIVGMQEITKVPEFPYYAKGIINLRGIIIPIIDVRLRLKKEEIEYNERTCIIVTNIKDSYIGFIVDSVNEVANIYEDSISDPPQIDVNYVNIYIAGVAKANNSVILLIDLKKILNEKEIELITTVE